jgi:transposase
VVVGVEGTGSYGAGLARHLQRERVAVVEVDRPNRQRRRRQGKSDPHDVVTAARAAQAGDALGAAKLRDRNVEAIRVLRVARGGAKRDRTRAINQMRSLVSTAPDDVRQQLRGLTIPKLVRRAAAFRPGGRRDVGSATRLALRTLARRVLELDSEVAALDEVLDPLVAATAPELVAQVGVGTEPLGVRLCCNGSRRDAWSSGMQRDMGQGLVAYLLSLPRSKERPPQVDTLGPAPSDEVVSVAEQRAWYESWLAHPPDGGA